MTTILKVTHQAYDALVASTVDQIITLGIQKGGEYAGDRNRVENFVRNAINLQLEPEQVWAVYAGKHWDAIIQYVNDLAANKSRPRSESITGRVDDLIVYALLMKAMMIARTCVDNTYEITVSEKHTPDTQDEKNSGDPIPSFLTKAVEEGLTETTDTDTSTEDQLVDAVAKTRR